MHDNSIIEIDHRTFANNWHFLKKHFGNDVLISSVVKGNAYGHGIAQFTTMAIKAGVKHFSVFDCNEARQVKASIGNKANVMIMGWINNSSLEWAIENNVSVYVFEKKRLEALIKAAKKLKKKAIIHIEIETGMNRTGFQSSEFVSLFQYLKKRKRTLCF